MTSPAVPIIEAHGISETGSVREDNQDAIRMCDPDDALAVTHGHTYAIADGMGGYEHGGVASATALDLFFSAFYNSNGSKPQSRLRQAVQQANTGVYQTAVRIGAVRMGTTLSVANLVGRQLNIAHVGDSRIYLIRNGQATCLTNDHTMVGELVRMHVLSPDKVRAHNQRSILNKCLGLDLFVQPDVTQVPAREGDVIILCSDGVWSVVEDDDFAHLATSIPDVSQLSRELVGLALERDSDDNASAIAVRVQRLGSAPAMTGQRRSFGLGQLFRNRLSGSA
jgi:serine/threonine protein phosphatase PrpC